jgi:hypothetical protein
VNLPWLTYGCDFGSSAWFPSGGVSRGESRTRLDSLLARCSEKNLRVVRWFTFCDGRSGIVFDAAGYPAGLDAAYWRDMDAALETASKHGLRLLLVLFDFHLFGVPTFVNGVQLHGRRSLVADPARAAAVVENVLRPSMSRYGAEETILGWDVINEPEWATLGYRAWNPRTSVRPSVMRSWVRNICAAVHEETRQLATVGLASARGLPLVIDCGLDFYQVHWYDDLELRSPLSSPPVEHLDKPLLLGEYPTSGTRKTTVEILETARAAGYSGALAWSANAGDSYSDLDAL